MELGNFAERGIQVLGNKVFLCLIENLLLIPLERNRDIIQESYVVHHPFHCY